MPPFLTVAEVSGSLFPTAFVFHEGLDEVRVVFELRVDHLDVFVVFSEQTSQVNKGTSDLLAQNPDGLRLVFRDPPQQSFCLQKNAMIKVISPSSTIIRNLVDLTDNLAELGPGR